ncbi:hypothetical protein FEV16_14630 [Methylocystis sp. B8]|nr:hypothetical protein FEV16_14630 [Methylocystis sp. B8]
MVAHVERKMLGELIGMIECGGAPLMWKIERVDAEADAEGEELGATLRALRNEPTPELGGILWQTQLPLPETFLKGARHWRVADARRVRPNRRATKRDVEAGMMRRSVEDIERQRVGRRQKRRFRISRQPQS